MRHSRLIVLSLGLVTTFLLAAPPVAARVPVNSSILLYKPGHAWTGTLHNGVYKFKATFTTGTWTNAAASRNSLLFYNSSTGKVRLGTFKRGVFKATGKKNVGTGYTHVVASCDTAFFYNSNNGSAFAAPFTNGTLGTKTNYFLFTGEDLVTASCDSMFMEDVSAAARWGLLEAGEWTEKSVASPGNDRLITSTHDSLLILMQQPGYGYWATLRNGAYGEVFGSATSFAAWDNIGASATTVLFYAVGGSATVAMLKAGAYNFLGTNYTLPANLTIIVGNR